MSGIIAGTLVIGVVYAVQAGAAALRGVKVSIQRIRLANGNVFGVVLTEADGGAKGYGQRYGEEVESRG